MGKDDKNKGNGFFKDIENNEDNKRLIDNKENVELFKFTLVYYHQMSGGYSSRQL